MKHGLASMNLRQSQVIGLGQASMDYLARMDKYPDEDRKVELTGIYMQCGGPASTALVALSRLGVKTSFIGSASDDPFGREIKKNLDIEGIDTTYMKIIPGYTSQFAFIVISRDSGRRTIFWHRGTVPPLSPSDIDISPYTSSEILHLDGLMIDASIEAARQAKAHGMLVVMDAGTMREGSLELASLVDVLIASENFVESLIERDGSAEKTLESLRRLGPTQVLVTLGERGSIGLSEKGFHYQGAFPLKVVDTTGAGDVYHGGYIYGLLKKWDMGTCMQFASAAAAIKCTKIGARQGIPRLEQIEGLFRTYPFI